MNVQTNGSPDLIVLDFFYWGYSKNIGHAETMKRSAKPEGQNLRRYGKVTPEMLARVWEVAEYRIDICRATNGAHIEIY